MVCGDPIPETVPETFRGRLLRARGGLAELLALIDQALAQGAERRWRPEAPIAAGLERTVGWFRACELILGLTLAACARGPVVVEEAPESVVCRHGPECDAKWRRAREWVGMHSRWPIREDTDALIATGGPDATRDPAFVIRRVASATDAGTDVIVFGAGCTDRVRAFVDHVPARGGRWRNVTGPGAKYTECAPPVDELEASFVGCVNGMSR